MVIVAQKVDPFKEIDNVISILMKLRVLMISVG
jgi:hypothetical protein